MITKPQNNWDLVQRIVRSDSEMKRVKEELINNLNPRLYKRDENFLWHLIPQKKVWVHPPTDWKGNQVQWLAHTKQKRKNEKELELGRHKTNQY